MYRDIKINQITYHVYRSFADGQSVSSLIKSRIMQELERDDLLTASRLTVYNEHGSVVSEEESE